MFHLRYAICWLSVLCLFFGYLLLSVGFLLSAEQLASNKESEEKEAQFQSE